MKQQIIIGVDPHKLSATIEVVDHHDNVLASGRFATDRAGYAAMRRPPHIDTSDQPLPGPALQPTPRTRKTASREPLKRVG